MCSGIIALILSENKIDHTGIVNIFDENHQTVKLHGMIPRVGDYIVSMVIFTENKNFSITGLSGKLKLNYDSKHNCYYFTNSPITMNLLRFDIDNSQPFKAYSFEAFSQISIRSEWMRSGRYWELPSYLTFNKSPNYSKLWKNPEKILDNIFGDPSVIMKKFLVKELGFISRKYKIENVNSISKAFITQKIITNVRFISLDSNHMPVQSKIKLFIENNEFTLVDNYIASKICDTPIEPVVCQYLICKTGHLDYETVQGSFGLFLNKPINARLEVDGENVKYIAILTTFEK